MEKKSFSNQKHHFQVLRTGARGSVRDNITSGDETEASDGERVGSDAVLVLNAKISEIGDSRAELRRSEGIIGPGGVDSSKAHGVIAASVPGQFNVRNGRGRVNPNFDGGDRAKGHGSTAGTELPLSIANKIHSRSDGVSRRDSAGVGDVRARVRQPVLTDRSSVAIVQTIDKDVVFVDGGAGGLGYGGPARELSGSIKLLIDSSRLGGGNGHRDGFTKDGGELEGDRVGDGRGGAIGPNVVNRALKDRPVRVRATILSRDGSNCDTMVEGNNRKIEVVIDLRDDGSNVSAFGAHNLAHSNRSTASRDGGQLVKDADVDVPVDEVSTAEVLVSFNGACVGSHEDFRSIGTRYFVAGTAYARSVVDRLVGSHRVERTVGTKTTSADLTASVVVGGSSAL